MIIGPVTKRRDADLIKDYYIIKRKLRSKGPYVVS